MDGNQLKRRDPVHISECLRNHKTCGHKDERMYQLIKEFSGLIRLSNAKMKKPGKARLLIRCRHLTVVSCIFKAAQGVSSNQSAAIVSWTLRYVVTKLVTLAVSEIIEAALWLCKFHCRRMS
jgi:hypothetical protein